MRIILASASPRRKEILENLGVDFEVVTSNAKEISTASSPEGIAMELSQIKAQSVAEKICEKDTLVIGCDTIVVKENKILGKPKTADEAEEMLTLLSGDTHTVISGLTLIFGGKTLSKFEKTTVFFDSISDEQMEKYIATKDPFDKAGGYGIQGKAAKFIKGINGCYFNVVGFPVHLFYQMLNELNIEL